VADSSRREIRESLTLWEQAIARQWPVPAEKRPEVIDALVKLALDPGTKPRQRITAVRVLIQADKASLDAVAATIRARADDREQEQIPDLWRCFEEARAQVAERELERDRRLADLERERQELKAQLAERGRDLERLKAQQAEPERPTPGPEIPNFDDPTPEPGDAPHGF
jgi:hypothetical protein